MTGDKEERAKKDIASENLGHVLVLGLGKSGKAVVEYLLQRLDRVDTLTVVDAKNSPASEAFVKNFREKKKVSVALGCEHVEGVYDLCIVSPGIPAWSELYCSAEKASALLISEVEFAWRESVQSSRWIAVTGTNGKTTVTALIAHLLQSAGVKASAVGNIGDTCIKAVAEGNTDVYVVEVSSYQLASTVCFAPNIAVVLNITPDHLHWHKTFEAYRDAKFKLLENLSVVPDAVAVMDATNDVVRSKIRELRSVSDEERGFAYIPLGSNLGLHADMRTVCKSKNAAFIDAENVLQVAYEGAENVLINAKDLKIKGEHNASNALAASAAVLAFGLNATSVLQGLRTFAPLEHRIEPCGVVSGVQCYNDSKATNVDATLKALEAFPEVRPIVLLGGDDKGTDLAPLVDSSLRHARAVVCFGAAGERFEHAFADQGVSSCDDVDRSSFFVLRAGHLEDALDAALGVAQAGDVVLLSPACASFDEFSSFEERGCVFKELVTQRAVTLDV